MPRKTVLMDHDGGVDDLLSLALLLTMPHVEVVGVAVTPADCYLDAALDATTKLLAWLGRENVPVASGDLHGVNAFPAEWRAQPRIINALPIMLVLSAHTESIVSVPARTFLAEKIAAAPHPLTILMTGPASNLVAALETDPDLRHNIAEVVWMAGAIDVPGNVRTYAHDGSAEWNAFWDAIYCTRIRYIYPDP